MASIWTVSSKISSKLFMKSYVLAFPNIWHGCNKGQGQSKVTIWTILVLFKYPIAHIKFQCHRSIGSREEDF